MLTVHSPHAGKISRYGTPLLIDYRAYQVKCRGLWLEVFQQELHALHESSFVHRDLSPSGIGRLYSNNILLTDSGLQLVDVGISADVRAFPVLRLHPAPAR